MSIWVNEYMEEMSNDWSHIAFMIIFIWFGISDIEKKILYPEFLSIHIKKSRHALFYNTTLLWHKQFWLVLLHVQSVTKYTTNWNAVIISGIITNNTRLSSFKFHEGQPIYIKCATMKKLLVFQRRAVTPIILCFIRVHNL